MRGRGGEEREMLRENFNTSNKEKVDGEKDEDAAVQHVHEGSSSPACGMVVEDGIIWRQDMQQHT